MPSLLAQAPGSYVHSVVGPPIALCPEDLPLLANVDEPLAVDGESYDDNEVVAHRWSIVSVPDDSAPTLSPLEEPDTFFTGNQAGDYLIRLTVTDDDGETGSCDVPIDVGGAPEIECPTEPIMAPTRSPVDVSAFVLTPERVASLAWELTSSPAGSTARFSPVDEEDTRITLDRQGDYVGLFTATGQTGLSSSCEVSLIGLPTPPPAI